MPYEAVLLSERPLALIDLRDLVQAGSGLTAQTVDRGEAAAVVTTRGELVFAISPAITVENEDEISRLLPGFSFDAVPVCWHDVWIPPAQRKLAEHLIQQLNLGLGGTLVPLDAGRAAHDEV